MSLFLLTVIPMIMAFSAVVVYNIIGKEGPYYERLSAVIGGVIALVALIILWNR